MATTSLSGELNLKTRIIALLFVGSVLLNIAGLVFFILFLNLRGSYKAVRRDKAVLERNLAMARSQNVMGTALNNDRIAKEVFASQVDGELDTFAFQPPSLRPNATGYTLVVYLHGMGSNYMEPFVNPGGEPIANAICSKNPSLGLLSCSYRKESSWGNEKALADINQNVRQVLQTCPFNKIVVMGTSMGGSVALNYAAVAPPDIKEKIVGVVSIESAGDLAKLYQITAHAGIRPVMIVSFGGTPEQVPDMYRRYSFLNNLSQLSKNLRFYVLSAKKDRIVPLELQNDVVDALKKSGYEVRHDEIEGSHALPPSSVYADGMDFVLGKQ